MRPPLLLIRFCAITAGLSLAPVLASAQGWWLEGGPVYRGGMTLKVGGSSYAQQMSLHDPSASGPLSPPGGIGPASGYGDRIYDNGYVKLDPGTGKPESLDPNTTWYWGYNNAGQYNAEANSLSFQRQGAAGYTVLTDRPMSAKDEPWGAGLQLALGLPLKQSGEWTLDLCFGLQGIWGGQSKIQASNYREDVRQITVTDTYDTSGIGAGGFPGAGFHGTYLGPFDNPPVIPSPVIPNIPGSRSPSTSAALSTSADTVSLEVDQNIYQMSVGPQVGYEVSKDVRLSLRPTISVNVIDVEARRSEVFVQQPAAGPSAVVNRWSNHESQMDVFFGLGVTGSANVEMGKGYYASVFGGYEWVSQKVEFTVGPNTVSFDGSGYVIGVTLGKRF
jgi:hypothetical protein